jgi:hypothetical protein
MPRCSSPLINEKNPNNNMRIFIKTEKILRIISEQNNKLEKLN